MAWFFNKSFSLFSLPLTPATGNKVQRKKEMVEEGKMWREGRRWLVVEVDDSSYLVCLEQLPRSSFPHNWIKP